MALFRSLIITAAVMLPAAAAAQTAGVTIEKPWMRYLLPSVPAAGYMIVHNNTNAPLVLTGAASPACGMLMLHQSQDNSGMAMMMDVPNITIPPHAAQVFAPGGYHLMCMQPAMKIGDAVPVTLTFQDGTKLAVTLPVYGAQGAP
jgi:copper(I)-binding protein